MKYFLPIFLYLTSFALQAQVVITNPVFCNQTQTVTVTYDASKGNAALKDNPGPIYAHAGLITSASTSPTDWKFVQGTWGTADAKVLMTSAGNNKWTITYSIPTFYGFPAGTIVQRLAFVFRNAAGTTVGRDASGADIYYDLTSSTNTALLARFFEPSGTAMVLQAGGTVPMFAACSATGQLDITDNGTNIATVANGTTISGTLTAGTPGAHTVILTAQGTGLVGRDTFTYTVPNPVVTADPPAGSKIGATALNNNSFRLMLHAPGKTSVFVLGSFNDYKVESAYAMKRSVDGSKWWLDVTGLVPGSTQTYQYFVDGTIKVADPVSELILDPSNDASIAASVFPNMPAYPTGKTTGHVTVIKPDAVSYAWQTTNFTPPAKTDLVIYECLMRDFISTHSFATLLDTLNYFQRLGVNAIELMPVSEFENNNSWGYNVSYHGALDKYYGSPERFKAFVDAAHARGIAVILDVVYNHAFGQSPLAQLYWDGGNNRPAANNPWLNPIEKHPFNVGSDFNHESAATKDYVITTLRHWLTEYKVDGFRFDLSKGFTQKQSNDVGAWGVLDPTRVAILKTYTDAIWATNPKAYCIMEHFADNAEETQLSNHGMMLWGNMNYAYNEASMGWTANSMSGVSHKSRSWAQPNLVGYMESHDEERLMYKNLTAGAGIPAYSIKDLNTALGRQELVNAFFLTVPGPKMIWQFGEMGYDFSINHCTNGTVNNNCRLDPKPIKWDYLANANRKHLFDVIQALNHLRTTQAVFESGSHNHNELGQGVTKAFHVSSPIMNVTILGNFGLTGMNIDPKFQHTGIWYDYLTGTSFNVTNVNATISIPPGGYRVYTDVKIDLPTGSGLITGINDVPSMQIERLRLYPNPTSVGAEATLSFSLFEGAEMRLSLLDMQGRVLEQSSVQTCTAGENVLEVPFSVRETGVYFIQMQNERGERCVVKWAVF